MSTIQTDEYPTISDLFGVMDAKLEVTGSIQNMKNVSKTKENPCFFSALFHSKEKKILILPLKYLVGIIKSFNWPNFSVCSHHSCQSIGNDWC